MRDSPCGGVKQERLDWLAANPRFTKRLALYVGKQCRGASIKEVATDLRRGPIGSEPCHVL